MNVGSEKWGLREWETQRKSEGKKANYMEIINVTHCLW